MNVKDLPKKDLSEELAKREGVIKIEVNRYEKIEFGGVVVEGPAIIIVNKD
ncbi:BC1881 family protein [Bacillus thuringiensis]|uniref:BC1881 family protein n=1 Tax=Bacillus thuringiensis TaxID=1428 RepID=UPI0011A60AA9|nr:BC1881 family protein [Bacillus thuringiensis]